MRYAEISGKEIININTDASLGVLGQTDIEIDTKTGAIKTLILPTYSWFGLKKGEQETKVPWENIKK